MYNYNHWIKYLAAVLPVIAGLFYLYNNDPETAKFMPECLFYEASALLCPGCGTGRALYAFLHGDILCAVKKNVILPPSLIFLLLLQTKIDAGTQRRISKSFFFMIIVYWIARNIPVYPFTLLRP